MIPWILQVMQGHTLEQWTNNLPRGTTCSPYWIITSTYTHVHDKT